MLYRSTLAFVALVATLALEMPTAQAFDESKHPAFVGQWRRPPGVNNSFDGLDRKARLAKPAPLTPEYQAVYEANLRDQAEGGQGTDPTFICIPDGMPRAMNVIFPMEIVITPKITYMMIEYLSMLRRIFTDGRGFPENPADFERSFMGYSIGKWVDTTGTGRYDMLEIETRLLKGPRSYDATGLPLHEDNKTIVKERLFLDKDNPNVMLNEITTFDNALTRPWTVVKRYNRVINPIFIEAICAEGNQHLRIGKDNYMVSADGHLMPTRKNQPPPDLRYFKQTQR